MVLLTHHNPILFGDKQNRRGDYEGRAAEARERSDWKRLCRKCHYIYDRGIKGNPNTKITDEMIAIIRNTPKKKGSIIKLAKQFGVHRVTIRRYCRDIPRIYA